MLMEMRIVPTLSNGFIEAISLNVGSAVIVPIRGIVSRRSPMAESSVFRVSWGLRLSSSM